MAKTNRQIIQAQYHNHQLTGADGQPLKIAVSTSVRKVVPALKRDVSTSWLAATDGTDWLPDLIDATTFIVSQRTRKNAMTLSLLTSPLEWDLLWAYRGGQVIPVTLTIYPDLTADEERNQTAASLARYTLLYEDAKRTFVDFGRRNQFFARSKRDFAKLAGLKETTLHYYLTNLHNNGPAVRPSNTKQQRTPKRSVEAAPIAGELHSQTPSESDAININDASILLPRSQETSAPQPGEPIMVEPDKSTVESLIAAASIGEHDPVVHNDAANNAAVSNETPSFADATAPTHGVAGIPPSQAQDDSPKSAPSPIMASQASQEMADPALDPPQPVEDGNQPDQPDTGATSNGVARVELVPVEPYRVTADSEPGDTSQGQLPLYIEREAA